MIRFDNHAFKGLDDSLKHVLGLLNEMGAGVSALVAMLPQALESASSETHAAAKAIDKTINDAEAAVDSTVAAMINKFTLMGEDLRFVLASIKIAGTLERMADKIKNCTKRLARTSHPIDAGIKVQLAEAVAAVGAMVPLTLAQIVDYKDENSEALLKHGAAVQKAYRTILLDLHAHRCTADDETHLLLVAKNLDQAGDMAVEIMKICHVVHRGTKYEKSGNAA